MGHVCFVYYLNMHLICPPVALLKSDYIN